MTYRALPELTPDDRLALDELRGRGVDARPAIWNDPAVAWASFDAVVLRSCWDYHRQPQAFAQWLAGLAAAGVRVLNPVDLALWNMDKRYLIDLAAANVPVVPTRVLDPASFTTVAALRRETGWSDIILKPAISATAWRLCRVTNSTTDVPDEIRHALDLQHFLAQPFLDRIAAGEWSLVFFDGVFSHAVLKQPRAGEFRVQEEYGGRATPMIPPPTVRDGAAAALAAAPQRTLYARVDGVLTADGFVLIELELLEPALYLASAAHASRRFADAIARACD
ncbi:MAG TPA: hypothetical protein VFJ02_07075 [Vicinamibacterales bacterium]|nr:hypothetical protein [Vicinamibacterales bacterium]